MRYCVACGIDDNYVQHASVMLLSLSLTNRDCIFDVYILALNVSKESKDKIDTLFYESNIFIHYVDTDESLLTNFPIRETDYLSIAAYLRLFIPVLLPNSISTILYLDSDIIVNNSIKDLYNLDLSDYCGAACLDVDQANCDRLNYNRSYGYFNSGVFLLNLDKLRSLDFMGSVLEFVTSKKITLNYHDQDVLNYTLRGKIKAIDHKWNMLECYYLEKEKRALFPDIECGMNDLRIIHFSSAFKPWNFGCKHPRKGEYFKYLQMIPWGDSQLHKYNAFNRMRLWAKIVILCGGSLITVNKIKQFAYKILNLIK